jgi:hypothetical protein
MQSRLAAADQLPSLRRSKVLEATAVSMGTCFLRSFPQDASALPPIGTPIVDTDTMLVDEDSVYSGSGSGSGSGDMVVLSVEFNL